MELTWCGTLSVCAFISASAVFDCDAKRCSISGQLSASPLWCCHFYSPPVSANAAANQLGLFSGPWTHSGTLRRDVAADDDRSAGWRSAAGRFNAGGRAGSFLNISTPVAGFSGDVIQWHVSWQRSGVTVLVVGSRFTQNVRIPGHSDLIISS